MQQSRLRIGYYIGTLLLLLILSMVLACGGAVTDSSTPSPTSLPSVQATAPKIDVHYSTLRKWSPNGADTALGLEIALERDNVTEQELIGLIRQLSSHYDPVVIRVFTSRTAYEQEKANKFGSEYKSDYILFYVKNGTGSGLYSGFNEIRWMQESGRFADKYGKTTPL